MSLAGASLVKSAPRELRLSALVDDKEGRRLRSRRCTATCEASVCYQGGGSAKSQQRHRHFERDDKPADTALAAVGQTTAVEVDRQDV
jgi:hypothetical protein